MDPNHCLRDINTEHGGPNTYLLKTFLKNIYVCTPQQMDRFREHTIPITKCQAMYDPMDMLTLQTLTKEWTQVTV